MRKLLALLQAALTDFSRNNCPYVAAGIAYWTLFPLFPLVLAGISILGFVYSTVEEQRRLVEASLPVVPVRLHIQSMGTPWQFPVLRRGKVEVRFGRPLAFSPETSYLEATNAIAHSLEAI